MTAKEMFESYVANVRGNEYSVEPISDNPPTYVIYGGGEYGYKRKIYTLIFENYTLKIIPRAIFDIEEVYTVNEVVNSGRFGKRFKNFIIQQMKELGWI